MKFNPSELVNEAVQRAVRDRLAAALDQPIPGQLTLTCQCGSGNQADDQLTAGDLVRVTDWLDRHSRHGERQISLTIPAGTDTKVRIEL